MTTVHRCSQHTQIGQAMQSYVMQTLPYHQHHLEDHSLTNRKPIKRREYWHNVVMMTSARDHTSCCILYRLQVTKMDIGNTSKCQSQTPGGNSDRPGLQHVTSSVSDRWIACSWRNGKIAHSAQLTYAA